MLDHHHHYIIIIIISAHKMLDHHHHHIIIITVVTAHRKSKVNIIISIITLHNELWEDSLVSHFRRYSVEDPWEVVGDVLSQEQEVAHCFCCVQECVITQVLLKLVTITSLFSLTMDTAIIVPALDLKLPHFLSVSMLLVKSSLNDVVCCDVWWYTRGLAVCTAGGFQCSGLRSGMIYGES